METTIGSRIAQLIAEYRMTNNSFAGKIGASATSIGYVVGERQTKPGFDMIEKIALAFPDLNMDWLVRGTGPMHKEQGFTSTSAQLLQNERKRYNQLAEINQSLSADLEQVVQQIKPQEIKPQA